MKVLSLIATLATIAPSLGLAASPPISAMQWRQRIVVAASPNPQEPDIEAQRQILQTWRTQAADRDVALVEISRDRVVGASDSAAALRQKYKLKADKFEVLLIGKDGRIVLRAGQPLTADVLQSTIDAMPMRRAGER